MSDKNTKVFVHLHLNRDTAIEVLLIAIDKQAEEVEKYAAKGQHADAYEAACTLMHLTNELKSL